jgi:hypothetical protein
MFAITSTEIRLDQLDTHHPPYILTHMANSWKISHRGVAYAFGMLACLSLTVPRLAIADDTSDSQSPALVESHRQGEASIVALLAKLERQVEEDRPASAQDDLVAETIADLLTLVPYAPPSDAKLVLALPAHFTKRAREAEAGGRHGEANRFAMLSNLLAEVFKPTDAIGQQAPTAWAPEPPNAPASGSPSIAAPPASLVDDAAGSGHTPIDAAQDRAMTSPASRDASPGQSSAALTTLAGHPSDTPAGTVAPAAGAGYGETFSPTAARQQGASPIVALLAKLDNQIAADPATFTETVGETIADLLALLPNALPSDAQLVLALPVHCTTRAREAKAGGRFDEADRFVAVGNIVGDLVNVKAPNDQASAQDLQLANTKPAGTESAGPTIAAAPVLLPGDPASKDVPVGTTVAGGTQDGAMMSPPSPEASPSQAQAAFAGRKADSRPVTAFANVPANGGERRQAAPPATPQPQGAPSLVALLAKLDKLIATYPPGAAQDRKVAETIEAILTVLRDAPPSDTRLMLAMPVHFSNRAQEAEAGGRHDEANRFAMLAGLLEDLFKGVTLQDAATQQPKPERSTVAVNTSQSIAPAAKPLNPPGNDRVGDTQVHPASTTSPASPELTPGMPSAEIAGHVDDSGVAVGPTPVAANLARPRAAEESSDPAKNRPAKSDGMKPPENLRVTLREMAMPAGADTRQPLGTLLISPDRPSATAKAPAAPPPRVAVPSSRKVATSTAHAVDPQCRAIALKFEIGEEPSDAERSYLQHGCRQRG